MPSSCTTGPNAFPLARSPASAPLPGVRIGVGMRPFDDGHGRIVYLGTPDSSWTYLWPDGTTHSGGPTPLVTRLEDAYRRLDHAKWPELGAFSLEADAESGVYLVRAPALGTWNHQG
ncbi:hypothetical protein DFP74_3241 [Nocardiopsis sp. Huas11]|uniref:hypothetical protein n=1 Tax=Nocardiopsis sp. Huas11 TaxID=2183912 RepID=UPI000F1DD45C|nr:hypothetical protein [Nocardiopsis sp. Huas11]RKS07566.1 hypothetical protein DFP74_3241 [Nocardiopsis sp. Huas11]